MTNLTAFEEAQNVRKQVTSSLIQSTFSTPSQLCNKLIKSSFSKNTAYERK